MIRFLLITTILSFTIGSVPVHASVLPREYFNPVAYRYVSCLPDTADRKVILASIRNLETEETFKIKRGLQPRLQLHYFLVGMAGDSAYVQSCAGLQEALAGYGHDLDMLVYVDGHGKTFAQNLFRGIELARMYDMNLIVYDWPTDYLGLRKTFDNSFEAAAGLGRVLKELSLYLEDRQDRTAVTGFFHSMGNQLLKNMTDMQLMQDLPHDLFDNLILNAAAVSRRNHAVWVAALAMQQRIYVTLNDGDRSLRGAALLRLTPQLGLGLELEPSDNAVYIDFSAIVHTEHNLFLGQSQAEKTNAQISSFFRAAFHGKAFCFSDEAGFQVHTEGMISAVSLQSTGDI